MADLDLVIGTETRGGERALVILSVVAFEEDDREAAGVAEVDGGFTGDLFDTVGFGSSTFSRGTRVTGGGRTTGSEASTSTDAGSTSGTGGVSSSARVAMGSTDETGSTFSGSMAGTGTVSDRGPALRRRLLARSGPRLALRSCKPETVLPGNWIGLEASDFGVRFCWVSKRPIRLATL